MAQRIQKLKKQLEFNKVKDWGGRRLGAGRQNLSQEVNHMKRQRVSLKVPLHLTLRLRENLPSLRSKMLFKEFQESAKGAKEFGLYIIHFSIQQNHIHLFAEAQSNDSLSRGMRALAGRFAKVIRFYAYKGGASKRGSIFKGRYHLHVLKTAREVRNALEYVLLNFSKHLKVIEHIDRFSSGLAFKQWKALLGKRFDGLVKWKVERFEEKLNGLEDTLSQPKSWLAREGWMKAAIL